MKDAKRAAVLLLRILGVLALAAALVALLLWIGADAPVQPAEVFFLGTQDDADCAVLRSRDACVIIDTGEAQDAERLLALLAEKGVRSIDCLILTHPDKDHIGGTAALLEHFSPRLILVPYYVEENERYQLLREQMTAQNAQVLTLSRNREFKFGDLKVRVFPPEDYFYNTDNNYSLITQVDHGGVRMLFMGDAQKDRLAELEDYDWGRVDLYKVPHHGRDSKPGAAWIARLAPVNAVVTAAAPEPGIQEALEQAGTQVFYTVPQKDLVFTSDGETLSPPSS